MSLKEAATTAAKNKTTENTSGKNPAFYAKQKQQCIDEGCQSPVPEVRIHFAGSLFTPTNSLKEMLKIETDKDVLSTLVQNPRVPVKALSDFAETDRADVFTEDDQAYQTVMARIGADTDEDSSEEEE